MKRLYKIQEGKQIAGVCGGLAEYFQVDPTLVRIAWVIFGCIGGSGLLAYFVCAAIMPYKESI